MKRFRRSCLSRSSVWNHRSTKILSISQSLNLSISDFLIRTTVVSRYPANTPSSTSTCMKASTTRGSKWVPVSRRISSITAPWSHASL